MLPVLPASPPDISAILASLGVFSLAIAAVVGGIYKGIKEVRKGGSDTDSRPALSLDSSTLRDLVETNSQLVVVNREIVALLRTLDHRGNLLVEALQDHRSITRSQIEEQHRLRAATTDLLDAMRRRLP